MRTVDRDGRRLELVPAPINLHCEKQKGQTRQAVEKQTFLFTASSWKLCVDLVIVLFINTSTFAGDSCYFIT